MKDNMLQLILHKAKDYETIINNYMCTIWKI